MDGGPGMRLPNTAHTSWPWRIHELTRDFRLEDVWALPTPGGPHDFPRLVQQIAAGGSSRAALAPPARSGRSAGRSASYSAGTSRTPASAPGCRRSATGCQRTCATSSRPRVREAPVQVALPARRRVGSGDRQPDHARGDAHRLGPDGAASYRGRMAVLVKPNGLFGNAYMAAIRPFRHLIVYPSMMRQIERAWRPGARRWTVLYDADCGVCKWLLAALLRWDCAARLQPIALQQSEAADLLQELTPAERVASWHLISPGGERYSGGAAVPALLRVLPAGRLAAAGFARFPRLTDRGYRWVAEHRSQLSKWVPPSAKKRASQRVHRREQRGETHERNSSMERRRGCAFGRVSFRPGMRGSLGGSRFGAVHPGGR